MFSFTFLAIESKLFRSAAIDIILKGKRFKILSFGGEKGLWSAKKLKKHETLHRQKGNRMDTIPPLISVPSGEIMECSPLAEEKTRERVNHSSTFIISRFILVSAGTPCLS